MHRPSGATIAARGCSKQDLPLRFSSLQEQCDFKSWWASMCTQGPEEVIAGRTKKNLKSSTHQWWVLVAAQACCGLVNINSPLSYSAPPAAAAWQFPVKWQLARLHHVPQSNERRGDEVKGTHYLLTANAFLHSHNVYCLSFTRSKIWMSPH